MKKIKCCFEKLLTNGIVIFSMSMLSAMALSTDLDVAEAAEAGITIGLYQQIYKLIEMIGLGIKDQGLYLSAYTILFSLLYWFMWKFKQYKPVKYSVGLSLFFSIMYVAGMGFAYADSLGILVTSSIRLLRSGICILGFWAIYLAAINALYYFMESDWDVKLTDNKLIRIYRKHPFGFMWLAIMGVWSIHLLLRYPGTMSYDNANQLAYYFGYSTFTTAQPIFHTIVFSFFVQIGLWLGSENIGLFLYVIAQSLVMSAGLAYSLLLMKRWGSAKWLRLLTLGIYTMAPYYAGYASFPIKDYLYTAFFVLLLMYSLEWFLDEKSLLSSKKRIGWIIAATMMILVRNNGKYIYVPIVLCMLVIVIRQAKRGKTLYKPGIGIMILIAPLLISWGVNGIVTAVWDVQKDTPKEMLSLPFQQTARYVRDHGDDVTEEERAIIAEVLDYEKIPTVYMELTSDPVKTTYHADGMEDLLPYFGVWLKQFFRHPLCYIEATWNQNYYMFAPNIDNIVYNKDCTVAHEVISKLGMNELIEFKVPEKMHGICTIMVSYYSLLSRLPIIGLLNNVAFYIIMLFIITFFFLAEKCKRNIWALLPLWLTFIIIILSPQIQNQPRYAFPIIYSMPIIVAFYMLCRKKGNINKAER